jgi:hypothetical protein
MSQVVSFYRSHFFGRNEQLVEKYSVICAQMMMRDGTGNYNIRRKTQIKEKDK